MLFRTLAAVVTLLVSVPALAQAPAAARPYSPPRTADGHPDLQGIWQAVNTANWNIEDHSAGPGVPAGLGVVDGGEVPYHAVALAKRQVNAGTRATADTEAMCHMVGVPRITYMPHPFQIVQTSREVVVLYEYAHTVRHLFLDSPHPKGPIEWYMGDSRARWDGDTLVVDVVHFTDLTWFDRAGNYHSPELHVVERYTRTGPDQMWYEVTIEDPKVFTRPWKMRMPLYRRLEPNAQILEYECYADAATESQTTTAFVGATLVDGTGAAPVPDSTVIVRDGRIAAVGPSSRITVPAGATVVDLRGKTLLPGFVNAHGHASEPSAAQGGPQVSARADVERQLGLYASYGITSAFSLGDDGPAGLALSDEVPGTRARLFVAGPVVEATTPQAAVAAVDALAESKVDWVKIRVDDGGGTGTKMPQAAAKATIERAHQRGLPVAAHIYYLEDANALLRDGIDLIAHSVRDRPVDAEFIRLARERDVCVVPTLMREVSVFTYESTPEFFSDPFFLRHADAAQIEPLKAPDRQARVRSNPGTQRARIGLEQANRNLKALKDAGVRIAMGTDTGPPGRFQGYFEHLELEMMVKAGLTPMQAIVAATGDAARCMKKPGEIGTIQPGAWADLVVYGASPIENIRNTRTMEAVYVGGSRR